MIATFKKNNPSGKILLFIYAIVLKFPLFFGANKIQSFSTDGILYTFFGNIVNTIGASFSPIYGLITFSLLLFQAIYINNICIAQKLHKQNNYLTGMAYLLITSIFPEWFSLSAPLVVNTLIIVAFSKICTLYYNSSPKTNLFFIGLIIGIAAFISFPSILFLLLALAGIFIARPFNIKEWFIVFIGITIPLYVFAGYLFITDKFYLYKLPKFTFSKVNFVHSNMFVIGLVLLIAVIGIGIFFINHNFNRQVVQTRKSWQLLFFYFIIAALIPIANANTNFTFWILTAIPAAPIIGAAFFYPTKKWFPLVLHFLLFAVFVFNIFWKK